MGDTWPRQVGEPAPPQGREGDDAAAKKDKEFEEASAAVARHVKLLREYNEIKDVGQQLMGLVAENRGATVGSLYETGEFGVGPKD
ncbi:DNA repair protein SWI5-like protein [Colletotrichum viniferum]|nr:DNA repair protein SWI5-like protein [Colletotrichum viniferum]